jgi:hypothetical protein
VLKRVYKKLGLKRVSSLKLIPVFMLELQVFVFLGNLDGKLNLFFSLRSEGLEPFDVRTDPELDSAGGENKTKNFVFFMRT